MLTPSWKVEIVELINKHNDLTLSESDINFAIVTRADGALDVKVTPAAGSPYFNEQTVTYVPRDLAKAFLGLPLRIIVNADTTIRALVETLSTRYGIPFDTAVDFAQAELDKVVSFSESGQQEVEIPAGNDSFVWIGKLTVQVANDALDLATIIANANITQLKYYTQDENVSAVEFATMSLDWSKQAADYGFDNLTSGMKLLDVHVPEIVARMIDEGIVPESARSELETIIGAVGFKETVDVGDGMKVAKFNTGTIPDGAWAGAPHFYYTSAPVAAIDINKFFKQELSLIDIHQELTYDIFGSSYGDFAALFLAGMDAETSYNYVAVPLARRWLNEATRTDAEKAELSQLLSRWKTNVDASSSLTDDWSANVTQIVGKGGLEGTISCQTDGMAIEDDSNLDAVTLELSELTLTALADKGVIDALAIQRGAGGGGNLLFNSIYALSNGRIVPHPDLTISPPGEGEDPELILGKVSRPGGRRIWMINKSSESSVDLNSFKNGANDGVMSIAMSAVIAANNYDTNGIAFALYPVWTEEGYQQAKEGVRGIVDAMGFGQLEYAIGSAVVAKPEMFDMTAETAESFHSFITMVASAATSMKTITRSLELINGNIAVVYKPAGALTAYTGTLKIIFKDIAGIPSLADWMATNGSFTIRDADGFQAVVDTMTGSDNNMDNILPSIFNESHVTSWTDYLAAVTALSDNYNPEIQLMTTAKVELTTVNGKRVLTTTSGLMPGFKVIEG